MDPPFHSGVKLAVSWVDSSRWKLSKVTKGANISRQGFDLRILGCANYFVHWLPWERKNDQYEISNSIIDAFEGRNGKKTATNEEEKSALSPKQCTVSQVDCNDGKTTWIALWIASIPTLFSRSVLPGTTGCLQTSKECSRERDLAPMKKWYWKLRCILRPKTNRSIKKALNC